MNPFSVMRERCQKVEIYQDTNNNESFSILQDTLVGSLDCNEDSTNTRTKAPIELDVSLEAF